MKPSGSASRSAMPGSRVCQFGVSSRSESQRSVRHEFATSPRSRTTWSIERSVRRLAHRQAGVAGTDDDGADGRSRRASRSAQWRSATTTFVGLVMMSNTAERFCDWATSASISSAVGVGVDVEAHVDAAEAVADVRIGAEDAQDVHVPSTVAVTERSWMPRCWATAATPAVRQLPERRQDDLDRGGAAVLGGEALRVVGVERERGTCGRAPGPGRRSRSRSSGCSVPFTHVQSSSAR